MFRIFFTLFACALFFFTTSVNAMNLAIGNQAGVVGEELRVALTTKFAALPVSFSITQTNIPAGEWRIENSVFIWKPSVSGFYSAKFSAIDKNNNLDSETVVFSIINPLKDASQSVITNKITTTKTQNGSSSSVTAQKSSNIVKYLRSDVSDAKTLYQPVSLYYTKGIAPYDFSLAREDDSLLLTCKTGARFISRRFAPYTGKIEVPAWLTSTTVEREAYFTVPSGAKSFAYIKLPDEVEMLGCFVEVPNMPQTSYKLYSFKTGKFSAEKSFHGGEMISLRASSILVFNAKPETEITTVPTAEEELSSDENPLKNAYISSLKKTGINSSFYLKKESQPLTMEELAHVAIFGLTTTTKAQVNKTAFTKYDYYGFKDVLKSNYQGEIYLLNKLGYRSGVRNDFFPTKIASKRDWFFMLTKPLGIELSWWQNEILYKEMHELGLIANSADMKKGVTIQEAAKDIFMVQEILTKRSVAAPDENNEAIQLLKNKNILSDDAIYKIKKAGAVERGMGLKLILDVVLNEYDIFTDYQTYRNQNPKEEKAIFSNVSITDSFAPYILYAVRKELLPESWLEEDSFDMNADMTRSELLFIFAQLSGEGEKLEAYQKTLTACAAKNTCKIRYEDLEDSGSFLAAAYYEKQGKTFFYKDRFGQTLTLFAGDAVLSLEAFAEMINKLD